MKTNVTDWEYFDFHDSYFEKIEKENGNITCYLEAVNLSSAHPLNPYSCSMQIDLLKITFEKFRLYKIESSDNILLSDEAQRNQYFMHFISDYGEILSVEQLSCENEIYSFLLNLVNQNFYMEVVISFQNAILEWNTYKDKAWYAYMEDKNK